MTDIATARFCSMCAAPRTAEDTFCRNCGANLAYQVTYTVTPAPPAQAAPPPPPPPQPAAWAPPAYTYQAPPPNLPGPPSPRRPAGTAGPGPDGRRRGLGIWWLAVVLLGWIGGVIGWAVERHTDRTRSRRILAVGIALSVAYLIIGSAIGIALANKTTTITHIRQPAKITGSAATNFPGAHLAQREDLTVCVPTTPAGGYYSDDIQGQPRGYDVDFLDYASNSTGTVFRLIETPTDGLGHAVAAGHCDIAVGRINPATVSADSKLLATDPYATTPSYVIAVSGSNADLRDRFDDLVRSWNGSDASTTSARHWLR